MPPINVIPQSPAVDPAILPSDEPLRIPSSALSAAASPAPVPAPQSSTLGDGLTSLAGQDSAQTSAPAATNDPLRTVRGMSQGASVALRASKGRPADWSRAILSGALSMMAGFGSEGEVAPGGSGALEGIGGGIRAAEDRRATRQLTAARISESQAQAVAANFHAWAMQRGADEKTTDQLIKYGTGEVKRLQSDPNSHTDAVDIPINEALQKHLGQSRNGQPYHIFVTGVQIGPNGLPERLATVVAPGGPAKLQQSDIDKLSKWNLLPADAAPDQSMSYDHLQHLLQQANAAEIGKAKIDDQIAKTGLDEEKYREQLDKNLTSAQKRDGYAFYTAAQSQFPWMSPLEIYHAVFNETRQVDPKTGKPTPTALNAQKNLNALTYAMGGPDGVQKLLDGEIKQARGRAEFTPAQEAMRLQMEDAHKIWSSSESRVQKAREFSTKNPGTDATSQLNLSISGRDAARKDYMDKLTAFDKMFGVQPPAASPNQPASQQTNSAPQTGESKLPSAPKPGTPLTDLAVVHKFLDAAGGDKVKAQQLAKQAGWNF